MLLLRTELSTECVVRKLLFACVAVASLSLIPTAAMAVRPLPVPAPIGGSSGGSVVVPWVVMGCAGGIILAAFHANYKYNRELTMAEAWSCGMLHWFSHHPTRQKPVQRKALRVRG